MAADLKLEILYYRTASDFEMEFNLCGCCSMRMLTAKPSVKKDLLNALAASVSRSRVTVVVGELYSEEGIINIVSSAVGKKLSDAQKGLYTVPEHCSPLLPSGSMPLVAKSGELVGCIIESGPQAIILISEDRKSRHEVLKSTLYEYLRLISRSADSAEISASLYKGKHSAPSEDVSELENLPKEEHAVPVSRALTPEELGENIVMSATPDFNDIDNDYYAEKIYKEENARIKKDGHPFLSTLICVFTSILLFFTGCALYYFVYEPISADKFYEELASENAYSLEDMNSNFFAVISAPQIGINYPVVLSDDTDYHSTHLFDGSVNRLGTPYTVSPNVAENIVIHGFSDNGGFGKFSDYLDKKDDGIIATAPTICLQNTEKSEYYKIFSVFDATNTSFDYLRSNFMDETEKNEFITTACGLDESNTEVVPEIGDKFLTVVCKESDRTVVIMAAKSEETDK